MESRDWVRKSRTRPGRAGNGPTKRQDFAWWSRIRPGSEQGPGQGEQGLGQREQGLGQGEQGVGRGEKGLGQGKQGLDRGSRDWKNAALCGVCVPHPCKH
jgi:hypothetical protein